jgi:hypothetical protein
MKVVFLDIDGVLVTSSSKNKYNWLKALGQNPAEEEQFDTKAIHNLNQLLEKTGAFVTVISQWRRTVSLGKIKSLLTNAGFTYWHRIMDTYDWFCEKDWRPDEIEEFLVENLTKDDEEYPVPYVILDDNSDYKDFQLPHHVRTDPEIGFSEENLNKAIEILGENNGKH